jgi:hypothetical protein
MLMMKKRRPAFRTIEGWARSILIEAGAIRECEDHSWMRDRADPHARERALLVARQDPPPGVSPDAAAAAVDGCLARLAIPARSARPRNEPSSRGRDEDFSSPPAQIPACAANAPGSSLGSNVGGTHGVKPQCAPAHSRQSDLRGSSAQCPNHGRLSAVPLG